MRAKFYSVSDSRGFTLLEIIMTLVVAVILGTILVQYMSTSLTRSTEPITQVRQAYALNQIVEFMTADYENLLETESDPLGMLKTRIEEGNNSEKSPYYGVYSETTTYIKFPGTGGLETADATGDNNVLKAVITSNNQSVTVLFTKKTF
ncbi:Tfp pilus assembly protein FimT/FimU [Thermodesulfobacteriota bacterium]